MNNIELVPASDYFDSPLAYLVREGVVESIHRGRLVVVDDSGEIQHSIGDSGATTFMRSTAKPFQASLLVLTGASKEFHLSDKELAVIAGSHSGEPEHLAIIINLLERLGIKEESLLCGTSSPLGWQVKRPSSYPRSLSPLHCDCSGKHLGMLILCLWGGYEMSSYMDVSHPIQEMCRAQIANVCSENKTEIKIGIDGCGVPTFAVPLRKIAFAFAKFSHAYSSKSPEELYLVADAMKNNPTLVAGKGRLATELMLATGGRLIVKCGAEGLYGLAFPEQHIGMAIKISDGNPRAAAPVIISFLRKNSLLSSKEEDEFLKGFRSDIFNNHGSKVGSIVSLL